MGERSKPGVLILAGGMSERMKHPKSWLPFNKSQSFLEKIVREYYNFGCNKIVVVINEKHCRSPWGDKIKELEKFVEIVKNYTPEKGKSHSIQLGLKHFTECAHLFIQNVDNPFIDKDLLSVLYQGRIENGYTVPVFENKGGHPILISKKIISEWSRSNVEVLNMREILNKFIRSEVTIQEKEIIANINTQKDYEEFFKIELSFSLV